MMENYIRFLEEVANYAILVEDFDYANEVFDEIAKLIEKGD